MSEIHRDLVSELTECKGLETLAADLATLGKKSHHCLRAIHLLPVGAQLRERLLSAQKSQLLTCSASGTPSFSLSVSGLMREGEGTEGVDAFG